MAAAVLPTAVLLSGLPSATKAPRSAAAGIFSNTGTARAIGARYLAVAEQERDPAVLAARLPAGCAAPPRDLANGKALRRAVGTQRARDFAAGDTVVLDGWILARTEARLCAFAALTA